MKKFDIVKVARIGGMLLSIGGMVVSSWVGSKENEQTLQKLVDERLKQQQVSKGDLNKVSLYFLIIY